MKRGTIDHPKMRALCKALGTTRRYEAVGLLESLWHFTALYAWRGDVGRHEDSAIAEWVGWEGDPAVLVESLVSTRWLDRDQASRLVVHDWSEHCDDSVRKRMQRDLSGQSADKSKTCPSDGEPCPDMSGHVKPRARAEGSGSYTDSKSGMEGDVGKPAETINWQSVVEEWNALASRHGLRKVERLTEQRKAKYRLRKSEGFTLVAVEPHIAASEFLRSGSWFGWDWLMENSEHWLRVTEGKYDKSASQPALGMAVGQVHHEETPLVIENGRL